LLEESFKNHTLHIIVCLAPTVDLCVVDLILQLLDGEWSVEEDPLKSLSGKLQCDLDGPELLLKRWFVLAESEWVGKLLMKHLLLVLASEDMHDGRLRILLFLQQISQWVQQLRVEEGRIVDTLHPLIVKLDPLTRWGDVPGG
jgi:hypothetical protein